MLDPKPPLKNPKYERFCTKFVDSGFQEPDRAYLDAGFESENPARGAFELLADRDVRDRIAQLVAECDWNKTIGDRDTPLENQRQEAFCQHFVVSLNGTEACILAGYQTANRGAAATIANKLLTNYPEIKRRIYYLIHERNKRLKIDGDEVVRELGSIAFSNILNYLEVRGGNLQIKDSQLWVDPAAVSKIQSIINPDGTVKTTIQLHNKAAALRELAKVSGLTSDLNSAWATLKKYGYKVVQLESGYWVQDEYSNSVIGLDELARAIEKAGFRVTQSESGVLIHQLEE